MCAKFKISYKFKQNIDETHSKQPKTAKNPYQFMDFKNPYQFMDFKNLKKKIRKPKVWKLLPNVCDFQKENHT
jgi:hypothetical protein